jgi:hypothetical protein
MYPRNAASPERIAIGPVVQISDGAVQTSGCTVRIIESGGTEGDGGGTTAYSTDGVVLYTPTQAETDQASFVLIAKKSGCIPACVTIVTSASATAGKVMLSGETHTSAVIPTVTTVTNEVSADVTKISGDSTAADRLEAVMDAMPTGLVVDDNDPDPLVTAFETNLAEATNDHYNGAFLVFSSGALLGQSRKISDYDGTSKVITVATAFTEAPAGGDAFLIVGRSE